MPRLTTIDADAILRGDMATAARVSAAITALEASIFAALADSDLPDPAMNYPPAPLSGVLKAHRAALGLSLQDVADRAGLSKSHVWEIEDGRSRNPTVSLCNALATALGLPLMTVVRAALVAQEPK